MISNKRLARIKKGLEKNKGKLIVITFEDGTEIKVTSDIIIDSFIKLRNEEENKFINDIKGKEIVSCSSLDKLISIIKQLVEYDCGELEE
jgi:hypothetical protein